MLLAGIIIILSSVVLVFILSKINDIKYCMDDLTPIKIGTLGVFVGFGFCMISFILSVLPNKNITEFLNESEIIMVDGLEKKIHGIDSIKDIPVLGDDSVLLAPSNFNEYYDMYFYSKTTKNIYVLNKDEKLETYKMNGTPAFYINGEFVAEKQ